jgi:hypothetical protein
VTAAECCLDNVSGAVDKPGRNFANHQHAQRSSVMIAVRADLVIVRDHTANLKAIHPSARVKSLPVSKPARSNF